MLYHAIIIIIEFIEEGGRRTYKTLVSENDLFWFNFARVLQIRHHAPSVQFKRKFLH